MAGIHARDGLAISLESDQLQADSIHWRVDEGTAHPQSLFFGRPGDSLSMVSFTGVESDGSPRPNGVEWRAELDVGGDGQGNAFMGLSAQWDRTRLRIDDLVPGHGSGASLGGLALDSAGSLELLNRGGPFNSASDQARLSLSINNGDLFYWQQPGGNELLLGDLFLDLHMAPGTLGIDNDGLFLSADQLELALGFELAFRNSPATALTTASDVAPMLSLGLSGSLENALLRMGGGGLDFGNGRTDGLHFALATDFAEDFMLSLGNAAGTTLHFTEFQKLGQHGLPALRMTDLTLDLVDDNDNLQGICFGEPGNSAQACQMGTPVTLEPAAPGLMLSIRDAGLHAFPSSLLVEQPDCDPADNNCAQFDLGVIATLGRVDSDAILYGNDAGAGLVSDIFFSAQSDAPTQWPTNTHFMIADTNAMRGFGLVNANLLLTANQLLFALDDPLIDPVANIPRSGLRFTTDNLHLALAGTLGVGDLQDLGPDALLRISELDIALHAGLDLTLFPASDNSQPYLGFAAQLDLHSSPGSPSYLSLGEPSMPGTDLRISQLQGRVGLGNGRIQLQPATQTPDGRSRLTLAQDIRIAEQGPGTPATLNHLDGTLEVSGRRLGGFAIPGGNQWHTAISISPLATP